MVLFIFISVLQAIGLRTGWWEPAVIFCCSPLFPLHFSELYDFFFFFVVIMSTHKKPYQCLRDFIQLVICPVLPW